MIWFRDLIKFLVNFILIILPTIRMTVIRTRFAIVAQHGLKVQQIDVKTAFLKSTLEDEIFIEQSRGFVPVCEVKKRVYGL